MLKIVFVSILMVLSIFFGIYPNSENSPHTVVLRHLGIKQTGGFYINIIILFYYDKKISNLNKFNFFSYGL